MPGATLYYETRGTGPALLLIPGGGGDIGPFDRLAQDIADKYTVIAYERRGFSRSTLTEPIADADRLRADADDATRVLDAAGIATAAVLGSSSGAIVTLDLLTRHPDRVTRAVVHEPPLVSMVDDPDTWTALFDQVHDIWAAGDVDRAGAVFSEGVGMTGAGHLPDSEGLPAPLAAMLDRLRANRAFHFEHELRTYPLYPLDLAALKSLTGKLVLAGGEQSHGDFPYRATQGLAAALGTTVVEFSGDHIGYTSDPAGFAAALLEVLA